MADVEQVSDSEEMQHPTLLAAVAAADVIARQNGKRHPLYAAALHRVADACRECGEYERAESVLRDALGLRLEELGPDHPATATALHALGKLLADAGQFDNADAYLTRAFEVRQRRLGVGHTLTKQTGAELDRSQERRRLVGVRADAIALYNAARDLAARYEFEHAIARLERAIAMNRKAFGDLNPDVGSCLNELGQILTAAGRLDDAKKALREALYIRRRHRGDDPVAYAITLSNFAAVYRHAGDVREARRLGEESVEVLRSSERAPSHFLAGSLNNLATTLGVLGDAAHAESALAEAANILHTALEGQKDNSLLATILANRAALAEKTERYTDAASYYRQCLALKLALVGKSNVSYARTLSNFGTLLLTLHDTEAAEEAFREALETKETALGKWHPELESTLDGLALCATERGLLKKAEHIYLRIKDLQERSGTSRSADAARNMSRLGAIRSALGRADGEHLLREAQEIRRTTVGESSPEYAIGQVELATLLFKMDHFSIEAETLLRSAIDTLRTTSVVSRSIRQRALLRLATLEVGRRKYDEAIRLLDEAVSVEDQHLEELFAGVSERDRVASTAEISHTMSAYLWAACEMQSPAVVKAAANLAIRRKGLLQDVALGERAGVLESAGAELNEQLRALATLRSRIATFVLQGPQAVGLRRSEERLAVLRKERDELESVLAAQLPARLAIRNALAAHSDAVRCALPSDSALVEFVRVPIFPPPELAVAASESTEYYAVVLCSSVASDPVIVRIGSGREIEESIRAYLQEVATSPPTLESLTEQSRAAFAADLVSAQILRPVLAHTGLCSALIVSPDGDLWRLPFCSLSLSPGRTALDSLVVSYVTSARSLLRVSSSNSSAATSAVVIADPDYDLSDSDGSERRMHGEMSEALHVVGNAWLRHSGPAEDHPLRVPSLPGTRPEGTQIAAMLGVEPWVGASALEPRVRALRSPAVLHIASHGVFLEGDQDWDSLLSKRLQHARSYNMASMVANQELLMKRVVEAVEKESDMLLRASDPLHDRHELSDTARSDAERGQRGEPTPDHYAIELADPLLRSGLAMAGFNTWLVHGDMSDAAEDGLLTAAELAGMDLSHTEMVVLSACDTGLGVLHDNQGVLGLRYAVEVAGARTLVLSLWKVPDAETRTLMASFYAHLRSGMPRAQALRTAQMELREVRPDPYFWGAFVCQGKLGPLPREVFAEPLLS